ncbi:MAG TPA: type II secretion system protein [Gaiellaceae bacterium]|nr:type II secretion system protein [Gaiellaceae bacterium]
MFVLGHRAGLARITKNRFRRLRATRNEAGFTLIEVLIAGLMIVIIGAPLALILTSSAALAGAARERTTADQLAQTAIETIRTLAYTQVGITGGNPGGVLTASTSTNLPSGEQVTLKTTVTWVSDAIPNAYVTNADYKKVVLTVTRVSDSVQLAQKTTYIASASAPPLSGTDWVQIKRTFIDPVTNTVIPGVSVHLTGGPSTPAADRTDTTDGAGIVQFPALDSDQSAPIANYTLAQTLSPYVVYPDDLSPNISSVVPATPGLVSTDTTWMYKPATLTVNVLGTNGLPYTLGATISVDSSRCGQQTVTIASGSSSSIITTCNWAGTTVPLVPNIPGFTPAFDRYFVTAWNTSTKASWGATSSGGVLVPSGYPNTLTQVANVQLTATSYTTKTVTVTVKKGGVVQLNSRVEVTGGQAGVYLYGITNSSGVATFTVPVTSTAATFTVNANDTTGAKGTSTFLSTATSPIAAPVTIS